MASLVFLFISSDTGSICGVNLEMLRLSYRLDVYITILYIYRERLAGKIIE